MIIITVCSTITKCIMNTRFTDVQLSRESKRLLRVNDFQEIALTLNEGQVKSSGVSQGKNNSLV